MEKEKQETLMKYGLNKKDWASYNLAQNYEYLMFQRLLDELLKGVPRKKHKGSGRPRKDMRHMIFCCALKIYHGKSGRRLNSFLEISKRQRYIYDVPHFNTVINYLNNPEMLAIVKQMVEVSSTPLKFVETDFSVDSTGFSTSQYKSWSELKWGKLNASRREFRKCHITSGNNTNIITAIEITDGYGSDSKQFEPLMKRTDYNFNIERIMADKAYSSRKNMRIAAKYNFVPLIPFKVNARGYSQGCWLWRDMWLYFKNNLEEFNQYYHQRSNVESTFSAIKRKFGVYLFSKKKTAQTNEILLKALCHNLVVLIHESVEFGFKVDFKN